MYNKNTFGTRYTTNKINKIHQFIDVDNYDYVNKLLMLLGLTDMSSLGLINAYQLLFYYLLSYLYTDMDRWMDGWILLYRRKKDIQLGTFLNMLITSKSYIFHS